MYILVVSLPSQYFKRCVVLVGWSVLIGLFASPAFPWGSKGHEIIAVVAETHLTDTARKRIKELLPQGTTLADATTWPDKAGRQIPDMDSYHFINFPKDANTYDQQRDCKLRNCIIEAIGSYVQVLKSSAPRNEKCTAVRFMAHLVGDIHQPLHAGFAKDRGGNTVDVRFNRRKENLHSLWDTALVELEQGTPAEWSLESLAIVRAQAEQWATSLGYSELGSGTEIENHVSIAAHLALGFEEVERFVCFLKKL
jgi:hypothetical protein